MYYEGYEGTFNFSFGLKTNVTFFFINANFFFVVLKALDTYVKKTDIPSFTTFVEMNNTNIARWSAKYGLSVSDLYGTWRRRFALSLKNHKKTECLDSK